MSKPMQFNLWLMPFRELGWDTLRINEYDRQQLAQDIRYLESLQLQGKPVSRKFESRLWHNSMRVDFFGELIARLTMIDYLITFEALDKCRKQAKEKGTKDYGFTITFRGDEMPEYKIH